MQFKSLLKNLDVQSVHIPIALASNTDANSTRIDMSGYDGVMFVLPIEDSVSTGIATLTVEANTIDSDTGMVAITGASATKTCAVTDDINGTLLVVDVKGPAKRYVQGVITSATANIAFGTLTAYLYGAKKLPIAQGATVSASTTVAGF